MPALHDFQAASGATAVSATHSCHSGRYESAIQRAKRIRADLDLRVFGLVNLNFGWMMKYKRSQNPRRRVGMNNLRFRVEAH